MSRTGDYTWRDDLKEGDIVDCLDTAGTWYLSTVLDTRNKHLTGIKQVID
jgi:hypothetical protein